MIARRGRSYQQAPDDTAADDCVMDFLTDLDESLWVLRDVQRATPTAFRQAARPQDHIAELRRILHHLHQVLLTWQDTAAEPP